MISDAVVKTIEQKYQALQYELDERTRRLWAATEAQALGHGGVAAVARATGLAESTIRLGRRDMLPTSQSAGVRPPGQRRQPGGGRKRLTSEDQTLLAALDALVEPTARGDPMSPLRWTNKRTRRLAEELTRQGHPVSHTTVAQLLVELDDSVHGTRKTTEGSAQPDRDAQFADINQQGKALQARGQPVVSVDAKKKEWSGDFAHKGREDQPQGRPARVRVSDFVEKPWGKGLPSGVYDQTAHGGWVSVGTDHDTAQCAVDTLRRWWRQRGARRSPTATDLLVTADGGGSNASRGRLWTLAWQRLADETGLHITVCHFPPGTRKWNKIEHRMFCHITENWRGRPLISHEVLVNLIAHTTTRKGLRMRAELDLNTYATGIKVTTKQMEPLTLHRADFHGKDWNYTIQPREHKIH
jgi:hypothetical protein